MVNHGLATGALFLLVGMVYERTHTRRLDEMGGLAASMPWLLGAFLFAVFASAPGLPGLNNFVGEFLVIAGTFAVNQVRLDRRDRGASSARSTCCGRTSAWPTARSADEHRALPDVSGREVVVLAPVLALLLVFGVVPEPPHASTSTRRRAA